MEHGIYVEAKTWEKWTVSSGDDERVHLDEEALDLRADGTYARSADSATGPDPGPVSTRACDQAAAAGPAGRWVRIADVLLLHTGTRLFHQGLTGYALRRREGGELAQEPDASPLHRCLARALRPAEVEANLAEATRLLEDGADPNASSGSGLTPLHLATAAAVTVAHPACAGVVSALLERGADPNPTDGAGCAPLHYLFPHPAQADLELAGQLLSKGARPDLANASGETPLTLCVERAYPPRESTRDFARVLGLLFGFAQQVPRTALDDAWRTGVLGASPNPVALAERLLSKGAALPSPAVFAAIEPELPEVALVLAAQGACGPPRPAAEVSLERAPDSATLRWSCDEPPRAEGRWVVQRKEHRDANWVDLAELPDDVRDWVDSSPPTAEWIRYRVRHTHQGGQSDWNRP